MLATATTVLCIFPDQLNSVIVQTPGALILLTVLSSPLWKKKLVTSEVSQMND